MPVLALNRPAWPPVSAGLAEAFAFGSGNRVGQAFGRAIALSGGAAFLPRMFGNAGSAVALVFDGGTAYGELPLELGAFGTGSFSVTALVSANAQARAFVGNNRNGTAGGWLIEARPDGTARINTAASFATYATTTGMVFDGAPHFFTFTREGAKYSWFVDGVADTSVTTTAFDVSSGFLPMIGAQRSPTTPGNFFDGACALLILHKQRAISIAEHRQLRADVGRMLKAPARRVWIGDASAGQTVVPDGSHVQISGYAPTIARTSNQSVTPGVAHVAAAGYAPGLARSANQSVAPSTGHAALSGKAPAIAVSANRVIAPSPQHVVFAGYVPAVARSANQVVAPSSAHLVIAGRAAAVVQGAGQVVHPAGGHVVVSGRVPSVAQTGSRSVAPAAGHASVAGHVPVIAQTTSRIIAPLGAHLAAAGRAPGIAQSGGLVVAPVADRLAFGGYAPDVVRTGHRIIAPTGARLSLSGRIPLVSTSDSAAVVPRGRVLLVPAESRSLLVAAESRRLFVQPE